MIVFFVGCDQIGGLSSAIANTQQRPHKIFRHTTIMIYMN